jgi:hypothetical protein
MMTEYLLRADCSIAEEVLNPLLIPAKDAACLSLSKSAPSALSVGMEVPRTMLAMVGI